MSLARARSRRRKGRQGGREEGGGCCVEGNLYYRCHQLVVSLDEVSRSNLL